ncbi:MAG: hypothetical protein JSS07_00205 [Proteobacteria bacterium]|nr:hypothetical protein [Pseudomonadota bacterium]
MTLATLTNDSQNDVTQLCDKCAQQYLVKYWDEELDWYIELNKTPKCRHCQQDALQEDIID